MARIGFTTFNSGKEYALSVFMIVLVATASYFIPTHENYLLTEAGISCCFVAGGEPTNLTEYEHTTRH